MSSPKLLGEVATARWAPRIAAEADRLEAEAKAFYATAAKLGGFLGANARSYGAERAERARALRDRLAKP